MCETRPVSRYSSIGHEHVRLVRQHNRNLHIIVISESCNSDVSAVIPVNYTNMMADYSL